MKVEEWVTSVIATTFFLSLVSAQPSCKCLSYQKCWPSPSEISQLASQLSQPLIKPVPPASACYPPTHPSGNCTDVLSHLKDGMSRSNLPGAMQGLNFETYTFKNETVDACYYNYTLGFPCGQGNIPILGVDARQVSDVQAAVKFAARRNLKMVIKNTGHDLLGRSMARGAIMLWTHNLKNISYDDHFIPFGSTYDQSYQAITAGAGVQWHEAYELANNSGRSIVGGTMAGGSIGAAGGWIMGGGHSLLSPKYGLGVDNVIQFTVVLASGQYVIANEYHYSDLFWALRGGGGGTFGVVMSVTYRTHEILPITALQIQINVTTPEIAQNVATEYFKLQPRLADAGWGGSAAFGPPTVSLTYVVPNETVSQVNATLGPFLDHVGAAIGDPKDLNYEPRGLPSFYDWYINSPSMGGVGESFEAYSRLLSRKIVEEHPEKVAELALKTRVLLGAVAGGFVSRVNPDSTGLNPAWRESTGLFIGGITWNEGIPTAVLNEMRQEVMRNLTLLDQVSADSGTYFNEASLYEENPEKAFFGSHYNCLKAIKRKYDAGDLFLVAEGVGSDDWDRSLDCRRLH